eukprot:1017939-Prymnesium_polylepis.1
MQGDRNQALLTPAQLDLAESLVGELFGQPVRARCIPMPPACAHVLASLATALPGRFRIIQRANLTRDDCNLGGSDVLVEERLHEGKRCHTVYLVLHVIST